MHTQKKERKKEIEILFQVVLKYILLWRYVYMMGAARIFLCVTMFFLPVFAICSGISAPSLSLNNDVLTTMKGTVRPFYRC